MAGLDASNWLLVFVRAGALLVIFPLFSGANVPVRLRVGLAAIVAFLLAPLLPPFPLGNLPLWTLIRHLFVETSVGLMLGFVCRMIFFAVEFAGGVIATEMGLMLSTNFNPITSNSMPVPGMILYWLALILLLATDMHHWMIAAFQRSYAVLPIGGAHLSEALAMDLVRRTGQTLRIGLQMTAPMMAVSFMITLIFSVLSRAVPQMNVFAESFPVRTLAGLAVFGMTCNLMAQHIQNYLHRLPEDLLQVARLMGAG